MNYIGKGCPHHVGWQSGILGKTHGSGLHGGWQGASKINAACRGSAWEREMEAWSPRCPLAGKIKYWKGSRRHQASDCPDQFSVLNLISFPICVPQLVNIFSWICKPLLLPVCCWIPFLGRLGGVAIYSFPYQGFNGPPIFVITISVHGVMRNKRYYY